MKSREFRRVSAYRIISFPTFLSMIAINFTFVDEILIFSCDVCYQVDIEIKPLRLILPSYVCVCVCVCVCACERERERGRDSERERERITIFTQLKLVLYSLDLWIYFLQFLNEFRQNICPIMQTILVLFWCRVRCPGEKFSIFTDERPNAFNVIFP